MMLLVYTATVLMESKDADDELPFVGKHHKEVCLVVGRKLRSPASLSIICLLASALCVCNCVSFLFFLPEFLLCPGSGVQQGRRLYNSFPHSEVGVCFGNTLLAAHRSWSVLIGLWSVSSQQPSGIRTKKGINFRPQFWGAGGRNQDDFGKKNLYLTENRISWDLWGVRLIGVLLVSPSRSTAVTEPPFVHSLRHCSNNKIVRDLP